MNTTKKPTVTILIVAMAWLAGTGSILADSPKIGCVAELGEPAGGGRNWVLVFLKFIANAEPASAYRIYWKSGGPDSANSYTSLATILATKDPVTLGHLVQRAGDAGVDLVGFEEKLDAVIGPDSDAAGDSLREKLAYVVAAQSDTEVLEFQREALANTHPLMAAALGRAYFAAVPSGQSTFEVREADPVSGADIVTVGRATIGGAPEFLPPISMLTSREVPTQEGHLRVQLDWCYDLPLRQKFLHWNGVDVFRASRRDWIDKFGIAPPLNPTRDQLLLAVASGDIVKVNRLPVLQDVVPECPPVTEEAMFTDDNNRSDQSLRDLTEKFVAGDEYTYWVAQRDLLERIGQPSGGEEVIICDRIAPDPPRDMKVTNQRRFSGGLSEDFLRVEWPAEERTEVLNYYLYCSRKADTLLAEYAADPGNPNTASLIATIPNDGSMETPDGLIRFDHDASVGPVPLLGETVFYRLRAEDDAPCKIGGLGNLSGPSGPVPAARHDHVGPDTVGGRLKIPCCMIEVGYAESPGDARRPHTALLVGERPPGTQFRWVEFEDVTGNQFIGRYYFAPGAQSVTASYQTGRSDYDPVFRARFGHPGGYISSWRQSLAGDDLPRNTHTFTPRWECVEEAPRAECRGLHLPVDPSDGSVNDICLILAPPADVKTWIAYVQFGVNGHKTKFASGRVDPDAPGPIEVCFNGFPPAGGELCFYAQGFDGGGNPGKVEPLGCVKVAPKYGLPVPSITGGAPATDTDPGADANAFDLNWNCAPIAECFDVAFTPPPPNPLETFLEFDASGLIREWGTIKTARVPTAFGANAPEFTDRFDLVKGVGYTAKVRAVTGFGDERDEGDWSQPFALHWLNQEESVGEVPWPMRDSPGITGEAVMEWDNTAKVLRVEIGQIPVDSLSIPLPADTLDPYLFYEWSFAAYLQETSPGSEGKFLQVTHRYDEILTEDVQGGGLRIIDQSIMTTSAPVPPAARLWLRIDQPVFAGREYRVYLVMHNADGEIREILRTNEVFVMP